MSEEEKRLLDQQLWNIANTLRGKMHADEFRDYILGFIFYKYLSEKFYLQANEWLKEDGVDYATLSDDSAEVKAIEDLAVEALGYMLKPSEMFSAIARRGNIEIHEDDVEADLNNDEEAGNFILGDLTKILSNIEHSTMGTESEDDFGQLFEDLDLTSSKLGRTESAKNTLIAKVLAHLDKINFDLENQNGDVLGDAYEYLIAKFASGAGKKAGEFYTPQSVSEILARIVTADKGVLKSVYDPTCGSGSLLLRVARHVDDVAEFYGQEMNRTTYNLARMNMILHDVNYRKFDIKQEDTLEHPQHVEKRFEAIVANPPFSAKWSANQLHMSDDRFAEYGRLAPAGKADFAFIQHMIHQLADNGNMAVVMPHGVLFRSAAEGHIREYIIKERNLLDAVIGLPKNIFYGTEIPTVVLVFKKCRTSPNDILFIDASNEFENGKNQDRLTTDNIARITDAYIARQNEDKFSYIASMDEIAKNDYNLNIPRYVDTFEEEEDVNLAFVTNELSQIDKSMIEIDATISEFCEQLGINGSQDGVIEKLFSQEIRFKDANGNDYPDWKTTSLKAISERITKKNTENKLNEVLTNSATQGIISQQDYFDKDIANQSNLDGYYIVDIDDFVYNPRISVHAPVGPVKRNKLRLGVMSPLYSVFRFKSGNLDFLEYYFQTSHWHRYMKSVANYGARHDRMNITNDDLQGLPIPFPNLSEQEKIASFLSAIDEKIDAMSKKLDHAKEFKKGFLQRMFV